jgi:hypothetical protein
MKIKLGILRKIIREEIERTNIDELKLLHNEPLAVGGAGMHTGPGASLSDLSDLQRIYQSEMIPAEELDEWLMQNQIEVANMLDPVERPNYQFVGKILFALDDEDMQQEKAVPMGPRKYSFEPVVRSAEAEEALGKLRKAN